MLTNSELIQEQLDRIREQVRLTDRVAFGFHLWRDIPNIGSEGFKLACVPSAVIPRFTLLPLIVRRDVLVDSRTNQQNNKIVPHRHEFSVDIEASWTDLITKHGMFGVVRLDTLECGIEEAVRIEEIFNKVKVAFSGGTLQDAPAFFGGKSPMLGEFETFTVRVKTTAHRVISELLATHQISREDAAKFLGAFPRMARAAEMAHVVALSPSNGILPKSIEAINTKEKSRFDDTDNWLIRQFPDYNSNSRLSQKSQGDDINRLAALIAAGLSGNQQQAQAAVPQLPTTPIEVSTMANDLEDRQIQAQLEEQFNINAQDDGGGLSLFEDVPELTLPNEQEVIEKTLSESIATSNGVDFGQCQAEKTSGGRCGNKAVSALGACAVAGHQTQLRKSTEE